MPHQIRSKVHTISLNENSIKIHCKWVAHLTHLRSGGGHDIWNQCTKHRVIVLFLINAFHSFEIELDRVFPSRNVFHRLPRTIYRLTDYVYYIWRGVYWSILLKCNLPNAPAYDTWPLPWGARILLSRHGADKRSAPTANMLRAIPRHNVQMTLPRMCLELRKLIPFFFSTHHGVRLWSAPVCKLETGKMCCVRTIVCCDLIRQRSAGLW